MATDDEREELVGLVRAAREHVEWLERGGVSAVPRRKKALAATASPPAPVPVTAAPTPVAAATPADAPSLAATPYGDPFGARGLQVIRDDLGDCRRCKLCDGRNSIVYGVGSPEAPLVFVGEGPGADEDRLGEPFVGRAGQLLDRMIAAMGFRRDEVYICNVVKCRPPGNRTPEPDEVAACEPFLKRQLASLRPRMIVALGKSAAQALLKTQAPISSFRGQFKSYEGIPLMPTFHPAFLLRTPSAKREVWDDLKKVMAELDRLGIKRSQAPVGDGG